MPNRTTVDGLEDRTLVCFRCSREFVWTAGEQEFYLNRELSEPKRCPECRASKRRELAERGVKI